MNESLNRSFVHTGRKVVDSNDRRQEFLTVANDLFNRFGYKKTTLADIANEIGISKSSLYNYYKSKDELFREIVTDWLKKDLVTVSKLLDSKEPVVELTTNIIQTLYDHQQVNRGVEDKNWADFFDSSKKLYGIIEKFYKEIHVTTTKALENAYENGELIFHDFANSAKMILLISAGARHINDFFNANEPWGEEVRPMVEAVLSPYLVKKEQNL